LTFQHAPTPEIVSAPNVYGFDTGVVSYYRGWQDLRLEDFGALWEHFVLNEIMARQRPAKSCIGGRSVAMKWTLF